MTDTPKPTLSDEIRADLKALDFTVPPFADNGIGGVMSARGEAYLDEYVLSCDDGPDYEPDEDERELLQDFMAGLLNDEAMFGPVRELLNDRNALHGRVRELAEIAMGNGQEIGRLLIENASLTARAEKAEQQRDLYRSAVIIKHGQGGRVFWDVDPVKLAEIAALSVTEGEK